MLCATSAAYAQTAASSVSDQAAARDADHDYSAWAADPTAAGPDLPPAGRSLFDHLMTEPAGIGRAYRIPFPFSALVDRVQARLAQREYSGGTRTVIIPMGRSLQRTAAAPDFFRFPRIVLAVTGEPATDERDAGMLLKDRLYVGYVEKTGVLEVVSYNEPAGRFEFQLVKDYRAGAEPKVFYANRSICISCHQNHAPIFSRAIWGETNANGRVAQLLREHGQDLQLSAQANIDFPDDIDKASVRASSLVGLQTMWREGCADARNRSQSRRCRAAAFTAILQLGLSGNQDFDASAPRYHSDFVSTFGRVWSQKWPHGLSMAQSGLPDRNPLGGVGATYAGGGTEESSFDWTSAAHVPADLDPLNPRPSHETWRFAGALDSTRIIGGWARFFAADDFRALDAHLVRQADRQRHQRAVFRARCTASRDGPGKSGLTLQCARDVAATQGATLAARVEASGTGRIDWITFGPAETLRDLVIAGESAQSAGAWHVLRTAPEKDGLAARLPDGRVLASIEIRWLAGVRGANPSRSVDAQFEAVVLDDFAMVRGAVDRLLEQQPALFDDGPLVRARLMRALFSELGMPQRSWCCIDDTGMPPAMLDTPEVDATAIAAPALQPFFRYCAMCHLTHERFPPNFLTGNARQVEDTLRQCAPRMLVRLSAWRTPVEQRIKSPMPPATALRALGTTAQRWAQSEELDQLRAYLENLSPAQRQPDAAGASRPGYEALPPCLPPLH
jgi:hypothetical protein